MSLPVCPTCDDPIDPTHAPVARIKGSKIVTFCSRECADGNPKPKRARDSTSPTPLTAPKVPVAAMPAPANVPSAAAGGKKQAAPETMRSTPRPTPVTASSLPPVSVQSPSMGAAALAIDDDENYSLKKRHPRGKRKLIALACAAAIGGGGLVAYDALGKKKTDAASLGAGVNGNSDQKNQANPSKTSDKTLASAVKNTRKAEPIESNPEKLYTAATSVLSGLRKSPSRRIVRLATMALARTNSADAVAGLRLLLKDEESELNQVELAYALARAGKEDGKKALLAVLKSEKRRDVRADAAIGLLKLGDKSGEKTLRDMVGLRDYKIAAAGHLAGIGDESAKRELEKIYRSSSSDPEMKLRAAVALGRAGEPSVATFLKETLSDGRFQVGAADALAALGDASATAALEKQLELNAMRVQAALAVRRLGASVSLEPLALALTEEDEVTRVTAAEAILILTGESELAKRD